MDPYNYIRVIEHFEKLEQRLAVFLAIYEDMQNKGSDQLMLLMTARRQEWWPDLQSMLMALPCALRNETRIQGEELLENACAIEIS